MRQISIKMLKQHGIPNANLHNLKIIHQKYAEKLVKDDYMYLANTRSSSKHSNFQQKTSFQITGFCFDY